MYRQYLSLGLGCCPGNIEDAEPQDVPSVEFCCCNVIEPTELLDIVTPRVENTGVENPVSNVEEVIDPVDEYDEMRTLLTQNITADADPPVLVV